VIVKEALANGRLTGRNSETGFAHKLTILNGEAQRLSTTIDAVALAAVISQPWVDVVLSGAATIEHLQSNLKAVDVIWDEKADSRLNELAEPPAVYWKTRSDLRWN
jgi:aryl-alcohol dehydrogenase-like predicted oxidoreductase